MRRGRNWHHVGILIHGLAKSSLCIHLFIPSLVSFLLLCYRLNLPFSTPKWAICLSEKQSKQCVFQVFCVPQLLGDRANQIEMTERRHYKCILHAKAKSHICSNVSTTNRVFTLCQLFCCYEKVNQGIFGWLLSIQLHHRGGPAVRFPKRHSNHFDLVEIKLKRNMFGAAFKQRSL